MFLLLATFVYFQVFLGFFKIISQDHFHYMSVWNSSYSCKCDSSYKFLIQFLKSLWHLTRSWKYINVKFYVFFPCYPHLQFHYNLSSVTSTKENWSETLRSKRIPFNMNFGSMSRRLNSTILFNAQPGSVLQHLYGQG